jgi:hypothetical protein
MSEIDLDISLYGREAGRHGTSYRIELRFNDPTSEGEKRQSGAKSVRLDPVELRQRELDPVAYGQYLAARLLAEPAVRSFFDQALAVAQTRDARLRLRLDIAPDAPELHNLRWETLRLPGDDAPLLTSENLCFSRYLSSLDWRPVRLRPESILRALVVIANPANAAKYELAPVELENELAAARRRLGNTTPTELATRGQATLENLVAHLRDGYDILYLVAHGRLVGGEPRLFLEQENGAGRWVAGKEMVTRIRELDDRPRLVVLASCQSAGRGEAEPSAQDGGALSGLGPQLAEAGIPAVVAMQGNVSLATVDAFMPVFFAELGRDGLVDRAMAVARGAVRERPDWWMPALFMRLKSGRIGYRAGFGDEKGKLRKWPALLNHIKAGSCTPILGPGVTEWLLGSRQEIARRWALSCGYPLDPNSFESLPQVSQYLAVDQDLHFMRKGLEDNLRAEMERRFGELVRASLQDMSLDHAISAAGAQLASSPVTQTLRALAGLPLPIYLTTNPSNLLTDALATAGKQPVVELCRWNREVEKKSSIFDEGQEPDYRPTAERPLVYHLFGRLTAPESLVITEDDYFDYLIGFTGQNDLIPVVVRRALADSALLFLGFDLDAWDFRVLFRSIMSREGGNRLRRYAHIAAQIDPEAGRITDAAAARRYLEEYFGKADISIFWGSVADFGHELEQQLAASASGRVDVA